MGYLFFLFIAVPLVELALLIRIGQIIGLANTILLVVVTGIIGASMARSQGLMVLQRIQLELESGRMPSRPLLEGVLILIGGIVLLTPGILTDAIGFALLIPAVRRLLIEMAKRKIHEAFQDGRTITFRSHHF